MVDPEIPERQRLFDAAVARIYGLLKREQFGEARDAFEVLSEEFVGETEFRNSLERLGAKIDPARNESLPSGTPGPITTDDSALPVWVVPTNEELMIARDTIAELA